MKRSLSDAEHMKAQRTDVLNTMKSEWRFRVLNSIPAETQRIVAARAQAASHGRRRGILYKFAEEQRAVSRPKREEDPEDAPDPDAPPPWAPVDKHAIARQKKLEAKLYDRRRNIRTEPHLSYSTSTEAHPSGCGKQSVNGVPQGSTPILNQLLIITDKC